MDPEEEDSDIVRITLLGSSQTGKTLFASGVVNRSISRSPVYQRTTRNIIRYVQLRPKEGLGVHLEDTPGAARITGDSLSIGRNHTFIVFFDWLRPETRRNALEIITEIRDAEVRLKKRPPRPVFLIGNKREILADNQDREVERIKKLAQSPQQFYFFSGSVMQNTFTLLEKPRKADRANNFFSRVHDIRYGDDFKFDYTALQLVESLRALFEETCNGSRRFAASSVSGPGKDELEPLLDKSFKTYEDSDSEEGVCARICRCCRRQRS